jgi:hypothetical protein
MENQFSMFHMGARSHGVGPPDEETDNLQGQKSMQGLGLQDYQPSRYNEATAHWPESQSYWTHSDNNSAIPHVSFKQTQGMPELENDSSRENHNASGFAIGTTSD